MHLDRICLWTQFPTPFYSLTTLCAASHLFFTALLVQEANWWSITQAKAIHCFTFYTTIYSGHVLKHFTSSISKTTGASLCNHIGERIQSGLLFMVQITGVAWMKGWNREKQMCLNLYLHQCGEELTAVSKWPNNISPTASPTSNQYKAHRQKHKNWPHM